MNSKIDTALGQPAQQPAFELDFDSDEPLPTCPLRKDGMRDDEVCESCQ